MNIVKTSSAAFLQRSRYSPFTRPGHCTPQNGYTVAMTLLRSKKAADEVESVTCRLCGRDFRALISSHLFRKHGYDPEHPVLDYGAVFADAPTRSRDTVRAHRRGLANHFERIGRRWTPARIRRAIRSRRTERRPLNYIDVFRTDPSLVKAARRIHGSWGAALEREGIRYEDVRLWRRWTREGVLKAIRALPRPLRGHDVRQVDAGLGYGAARLFGTWNKACQAAGVALPPPWPAWIWPRERVIAELRRRTTPGQPLTLDALKRGHLWGLISATHREFGTWRKALDAAGVPYRDRRSDPRRWTREAVLAALRSQADSHRVVHWSRIRRNLGGIERSATKLFGSLKTALREAGCNPRQRLHTREELLTLLKRLRKTHGYVSTGLLRRVRRPGFDHPRSALQRIFGGIDRAKAAIGATENALSFAAKAREAAKGR